jgi:N-acetyl-anhydromuramyl-L-alanine amidase AmpD
MIIDDKSFILPLNNYIQKETKKTQIVIGHTNNHDMKHYHGWLHRYNKKYKKTAAFTIDVAGCVYKHFDPKYKSTYFGNKELDDKSIIVLIENDGWLNRNIPNDEFYTWKGDIYKNTVTDKLWRGYNSWSNYSDEQFESAIELVKYLCEEYDIPNHVFGHNTKAYDLTGYEGVLYKSNIEKHFTDLSPSWDFKQFKNKIETK